MRGVFQRFHSGRQGEFTFDVIFRGSSSSQLLKLREGYYSGRHGREMLQLVVKAGPAARGPAGASNSDVGPRRHRACRQRAA